MENPPLIVAYFPVQLLSMVVFILQAFVGVACAESNHSLPEGAEPPIPWSGNAHPAYPDRLAATSEDRTTVTLQLVVGHDGSVRDPRVVDGAEPFASAALAAVEDWRYEPARAAGRAISVPWVVRVHFQAPPKEYDRWQVYRRERPAVISASPIAASAGQH